MRIFLLIFPFVLMACAASRQNEQGAAVYNGEYGKAGPGEGESCYSQSQQGLRCAEAKLGDATALSILRQACKKYEGKLVTGTCTPEKHIGTCRRLRGVPGLLVRYYDSWDPVDAQVDCGMTFKGLLETNY